MITDQLPQVVDERFGLVRGVVAQPPRDWLPRCFVSHVCHVAATTFASWRADPFTQGSSLADPAASRAAAIGEAMERYAGNAVPARLRYCSWRELVDTGANAPDPRSYALYSPRQYAAPGFPFAPMEPDLPLSWVPATRLADGTGCWVPAALAYVNFFRGPHAHETPTVSPMYAGIAAGSTAAAAELAALLEVIERDAMTVWWYSRAPADGVDVSADPLLATLVSDPTTHHLRYAFLALPVTVPVAVLGCLVEDIDRGLVAFGSACRPDPARAAAKAAAEAIGLLTLSAELADPASTLWRSFAWRPLGRHVYAPFRPDRSYLDHFGPDWRTMTDLPANSQLYLDPRLHGGLLEPLRHPTRSRPLSALPRLGADPRGQLIAALTASGHEVYAADLTTSDVRAGGFHVTRVLVPGYLGNAPAAFPLLGGRRLWDEPVARSWIGAARDEHEVAHHPPPPYS
ncbi:MAG: YcaO-like family protein [Pseudonocardiales bacterium]